MQPEVGVEPFSAGGQGSQGGQRQPGQPTEWGTPSPYPPTSSSGSLVSTQRFFFSSQTICRHGKQEKLEWN